ncbi:MAG: hypothetical protein HON90_15425 [Halobacteriovoraceae bacterium]|jgi:hypothetical protein|nr:hypothetical protein [Halobacteriovoraceae bacterium]
MKTIALIASLVLSSVAVAGLNPSSSWEEIKADFSVRESAAQVTFNAGQYSQIVSIMDVCYEASTNSMKTVNAVMLYDRVDNGDREIWVELGKKQLSTSRAYSKEYCVSGQESCHEWETVNYDYPLSTMVAVHQNDNQERHGGNLLFSKSFDVPNCK